MREPLTLWLKWYEILPLEFSCCTWSYRNNYLAYGTVSDAALMAFAHTMAFLLNNLNVRYRRSFSISHEFAQDTLPSPILSLTPVS